MKKTIEQVEQEIENVLSENDKYIRQSEWLYAPHVDFDFEIPSLELPEPYLNAYYIKMLYRGPSWRAWMRANPDGNYRRWLQSITVQKEI